MNGKPLSVKTVTLLVPAISVIFTVLSTATVWMSWKNQMLLPLIPLFTGCILLYLLILNTYLVIRLRKEFKEGLGKINKRPKMLFE